MNVAKKLKSRMVPFSATRMNIKYRFFMPSFSICAPFKICITTELTCGNREAIGVSVKRLVMVLFENYKGRHTRIIYSKRDTVDFEIIWQHPFFCSNVIRKGIVSPHISNSGITTELTGRCPG